MSGGSAPGFGKDPLTPCHGDSLVDQSFQSLKSKEIRDSISPTSDIKFHSMTLNQPSSTGWNVQSSSEVSPDGRAYRNETIATTDGIEKINGGLAEFKGRNEQHSSASHEGDDKNYVRKAAESSNTHLHEKVVIGDENSGRTEMKQSSTTSSSSSKVISSSSTMDYDPDFTSGRYLTDSSNHHETRDQFEREKQEMFQHEQRRVQEEQRQKQIQHQQMREPQQRDEHTESYNREETSSSRKIDQHLLSEETKRYVDYDKASPEYQKHVQVLMAQPGEIISNTVEYPKPNVKLITTVKRLPDGTIVRNKRYETEESTPTSSKVRSDETRSQQQRTTSTKSTHNQRQTENRQHKDMVDNVDRRDRQVVESYPVEHLEGESTKTSSVTKKFSKHYSSETKSEVTDDFGTHGFPSVKANKPTQEFVFERPQIENTGPDSNPAGFQSPVGSRPTTDLQSKKPSHISIPDDAAEVVYNTETKQSYKHKSNSERVVEKEIVVRDGVPQTNEKLREVYSIKEATPVRESTPSWDAPRSPRRPPSENSFSTHGFPSVKPNKPTQEYPSERPRPITSEHTTNRSDITDGEVVFSKESKQTYQHKSNTERTVEHEVALDDDYLDASRTHKYPIRDSPNEPYSVRSPSKQSDFSTHGFPSSKTVPDKKVTTRPSSTPYSSSTPSSAKPTPQKSTPGTSTTTTTKTKHTPAVDSTKRLLQKEKEVDAAHRAFAASLRCSSPSDNVRRDYPDHQRVTPRSSVSSNRTFRRDHREGSHDSAVPSETSRISSSTVTRQSPTKTVGGRTITTKQTVVKTKQMNGSNETTKSPTQISTPTPTSPSTKTMTTTTTTTKTITNKTVPASEVPKPDNQIIKPADTISLPISINEPLTTTKTITKRHISKNDMSTPSLSNQLIPVVEAPCIKKSYYRLGPSDGVKTPVTATIRHSITAGKQIPSLSTSSNKKLRTKSSTKPNKQNDNGFSKV